MRLDWLAGRGQPLRGRIRVPGDKSVSHRAIMLGSLAEGVTRVRGFLEGEDTRATARCFAQMGVRIDAPSAGERIVHGVGLHGLKASSAPLDCGNAGTAMRLLVGLLSAQRFESTLIGDESLTRRPMARVIDPLSEMGAQIESAEGKRPPLRVLPVSKLHGRRFRPPVASAQVKSALLLAGLYAEGETWVSEVHPTRDYTESMLSALGLEILRDGDSVGVRGGGRLVARDIDVPTDFSSAAFFLVAASVIEGSDLIIEDVGLNPRRTGLLDTLLDMGASIERLNVRQVGADELADLHVRAATLHGIDVPLARVPDMIDEFPALFVAAAAAEGATVVRGAAELRVKESDRIAVMATALKAMGVHLDERPDGAVIQGGTRWQAASVDSHGDHRCAMSLSIAAQFADEVSTIRDCRNVDTSFPGYRDLVLGAGMNVQAVEAG
ncbi:3-phosphoshikimate 1-carboxyvinyltransferase [Ahniella affigens]|uniref:3-phosphoshikimate 1-carboxyvinyltransferase n=1 Tax=Ahniella affigens TaxID=2021234 RepID=A0A2P1PT21_9GAMM|nr:3-phosphoshikimate 1-carboxyvinyltransferase [Ahniella affigens]AVP97986.1 3-phosphoshikimate 1-carboxyvinyltransferase [Ahniella affigens]